MAMEMLDAALVLVTLVASVAAFALWRRHGDGARRRAARPGPRVARGYRRRRRRALSAADGADAAPGAACHPRVAGGARALPSWHARGRPSPTSPSNAFTRHGRDAVRAAKPRGADDPEGGALSN
ncbi:MAG: hypothetical protein MZW92_26410 [Comamonadaceae bacterium]|nr:hypothetical protein [Comamonadaceae bacterium]